MQNVLKKNVCYCHSVHQLVSWVCVINKYLNEVLAIFFV